MTSNEFQENKELQKIAEALIAKVDELEKQWMRKRIRYGKAAKKTKLVLSQC